MSDVKLPCQFKVKDDESYTVYHAGAAVGDTVTVSWDSDSQGYEGSVVYAASEVQKFFLKGLWIQV